MKKAVKSGYAISMKFQDITRESLKHSLDELLYNPYYKTQVSKVSTIFKDRPLSAMDTAMYWVDYIIKHKGAVHNRSGGLDLKWYQFYLLDLVFVAVFTSLLILSIVFLVVKRILNGFRKNNKVKVN